MCKGVRAGVGSVLAAGLVAVAGCGARRAGEIPHEPARGVGPAASSAALPAPMTRDAMGSGSASASASVVASASASAAPAPAPEERVTSASGRLVAWVKGDEVWVKDARGERRLVAGGVLTVVNAQANLPSLDEGAPSDLQLSPDEKRIYFVRGGWATSEALFYAEVDTGKVFFFHDTNGYHVISRCKNKAYLGRVITFEHSYFDINPMSAVDLYCLVDGAQPGPAESRTGGSGRIGPIGFDRASEARFLATVCGVGKAPPATAQVVPARLRGSPVRCQGQTLRRADLRLLDGTRQVRFQADAPKGEVGQVLGLDDAIALCEAGATP